MSDYLFIISNALLVKGAQSIYSIEERFNQTLETIKSIDEYCPNNTKIMFDASPDVPAESYFAKIHETGTSIVYTGNNPDVNQVSSLGLKSIGESISYLMTLNWIKETGINSKRIYKISGRYRLNENFKPGLEHVGKYVFTIPTKTWMSEDRIKATGVDHVYQSRLWHMDSSLLDQTLNEMTNVIGDCARLGIDIEHALYKNFNKYDPIEMKKIGLCGNQAPSGEYVDD